MRSWREKTLHTLDTRPFRRSRATHVCKLSAFYSRTEMSSGATQGLLLGNGTTGFYRRLWPVQEERTESETTAAARGKAAGN